MPEYKKYRESLSDELLAIKDRVRNLINDSNWAEDGRYKEVILMEILKSVLPSNVLLGTGFVVSDNDVKSTQIDIIIYKNNYPELFKKGSFVIVDKDSVLGIIEVKSNLRSSDLERVLEKSHNNGVIIGKNIFNGIFAYETEISLSRDSLDSRIEEKFKRYSGYINNMVLGENHFMKFWDSGLPYHCNDTPHITIYNIEKLSVGYFLSNLIEDILSNTTGKPLNQTLSKFLYPIEEGKESAKKIDFIVTKSD